MAKKDVLVERLIEEGYLKTPSVIEAFKGVDRSFFIAPELDRLAYEDSPLPIGWEQTISAPHMVAIMSEEALLEKGQNVLEIGAGSGYHACITSRITKAPVYTIERIVGLAHNARMNLERAGCDLVEVVVGDGTLGYGDKAPYDRIIVTAGAPRIPEPLKDQLKVGGKILIPVGARYAQELIRATKESDGILTREELGGCVFVPLIGRYGWTD